MENVRYLGDGRGLFEHWGFLALFAAGPIVCITTYHACQRFLRLTEDLVQRQATDEKRALAKLITRPHIESMLLKKRRQQGILLLLCILGLAFTIFNSQRLIYPGEHWENNVFNAWSYRSSFFAANSYLLWLWSVVYPVAIFYTFHIAVSTRSIAQALMKENMLQIDPLHHDGRGGMGRFSMLNIAIIIYMIPAFTLILLYLTHERSYLSSVAGGLFFSTLFTIQSTLGLRWIAKAIRTERDEAVDDWNERIRRLLVKRGLGSAETLIAMRYRDCLLAVRMFPYALLTAIAVNLLTLMPALLEFGQILRGD